MPRIYKRKDCPGAGWMLDYYLFGKRIRKTFKTEYEAKEALIELDNMKPELAKQAFLTKEGAAITKSIIDSMKRL
jgi:hypothetical protein